MASLSHCGDRRGTRPEDRGEDRWGQTSRWLASSWAGQQDNRQWPGPTHYGLKCVSGASHCSAISWEGWVHVRCPGADWSHLSSSAQRSKASVGQHRVCLGVCLVGCGIRSGWATSGRHCRSWQHWAVGGGVLGDPVKKWGEAGRSFELQPSLTRLEAPASGAAETHLGSALRFFLP